MADSFQHFVITRFNLKRKVEPPAGWLERRVELFERYCLPSVVAQTNKNFFWLVLFGEDSPEWLRDKFKAWCLECEELYPIVCDSWRHSSIGGCIEPLVRRRMENEDCSWCVPYMLTTRIDNDDGMHEDFIDDLQVAALDEIQKGTGARILDYQHGVRYQESTGRFLLWNRYCGPFVSLLRKYDPTKRFTTVHSMPGGHTEAHKVAPVRAVGGRSPRWLQVLHDSNISNKEKGNEIAVTRESLNGFDWLKPEGDPIDESKR